MIRIRQISLGLVLSVAFLLSSVGLTSADGEAPSTYTLDQCLELALKNNEKRAVSRAEIDAAKAQLKQAQSAYWPSLSGSVSATHMDDDPIFTFPASAMYVPGQTIEIPPQVVTIPQDAFATGFPPEDVFLVTDPSTFDVPAQMFPIPEQKLKLMDRDNFMANVNFTLPLYTGGLISSMKKQAKYGVEAAEELARLTDAEICRDVRTIYYGAVLAGRLVDIASDTLARMEATLELTERMYKTGSGTVKKTDFLRNKSMVATIRATLTEVETRERSAKSALIMTMGLSWDTNLELQSEEIPFDAYLLELAQIVEEAHRSNPELARVRAGVRAAEMAVRAARSGHLPKLALMASAHHIENFYDAGMVDGDNTDGCMVGLGMEIPIFEGFRTVNKVKEENARLQKLREQQELLTKGIALQVSLAHVALLKAREQADSTGAAAKSAKENRELNVRAYQEELVETKDVIEAQLTEALLKGQYEKVLFDHMEAQAKLDFLMGSSR